MNLAKSVNSCVPALSRMWRRVPKVTAGFDQLRSYKSDDPHNWQARPSQNISGQVKMLYGEDNHRFHYKINKYPKDPKNSGTTGVKDPESRRRITQDSIEHQRRQERIIEDNKRRWQQRSEPKAHIVSQSYHTVYDAKKPGKRGSREDKDHQSAEEYSRRRRHQRLKELKRQARELRESRKGYNLPNAEDTQSAPESRYQSRAWLEKQSREEEEKYWHTWATCPDERRVKDSAEEDSAHDADGAPGDRPNQRRGFVKPTLPYDHSVRRFQTQSSQVVDVRMPPIEPPHCSMIEEQATISRRRPNGMEKQYLLARNSVRSNKIKENSLKRPSSLLQSHVFKSPNTVCAGKENVLEIEDIEQPMQPLRSKLYWQGLPRPVYKRFDGINRAVAKSQLQRKQARKWVEPPHIGYSPNSLSRRRPPIDSFSNKLAVNTQYTPYSEYTGYGRQTVCDAWQNFTSFHNLKSK